MSNEGNGIATASLLLVSAGIGFYSLYRYSYDTAVEEVLLKHSQGENGDQGSKGTKEVFRHVNEKDPREDIVTTITTTEEDGVYLWKKIQYTLLSSRSNIHGHAGYISGKTIKKVKFTAVSDSYDDLMEGIKAKQEELKKEEAIKEKKREQERKLANAF